MNTLLNLVKGDITRIDTEAIVNAANNSLLGGVGVDGAIHRVGGKAILDACKEIRAAQGGCKTGEAVITSAGKLPSRYVIHTVGPVWTGGKKGEESLLAGAYQNCLKLAIKHKIGSIAFPNISTGVYGFPKRLAAEVAIAATTNFLKNTDHQLDVTFVCYDDENYLIYQQLLK
jgi:O-acetyl-ADP-ribose deacetylase (regulator of RNase III)